MNIVMKLVMVLILWSVSDVANAEASPRGESFSMPEQKSRVNKKMNQLISVLMKLDKVVLSSRNSQESSPRMMTTEMPAPCTSGMPNAPITTGMPYAPITTGMPYAPRNEFVPHKPPFTTDMPYAPRNEWLSHESLITDLNKVKNRDIFDPRFILGGYTFEFRRFYHTSPDNIVELELRIYPYNRNNLKWALSHDIRLSVLDTRTRRFMIGTTFSRRTSWFRKSNYRKGSVRQYLWNSYVILNLKIAIKYWDYKSLIVKTEMKADSPDSRG